MPISKRTRSNRLISSLPEKDRKRLMEAAEPVELAYEDIILKPGDTVSHVYFPIDSYISQITHVDRANLEVGLIGNEGMLGVQLAMGVKATSLTSLVQGRGMALKLRARAFVKELEASAALRTRIGRYTYVVMSQTARNSGCNRFHMVESRLARWLLMTSDRAQSPVFDVTQSFLAFMLGVRRVGVTQAVGSLAARGLIRGYRGRIEILDSEGLSAAACTCYRSDRAIYKQMLG